jgi:hypothetical protein
MVSPASLSYGFPRPHPKGASIRGEHHISSPASVRRHSRRAQAG